MKYEIKCLLCRINNLEIIYQAELDREQKVVNPSFSGVSRRRTRRARYWRQKEMDIYYKILSSKDNRSLHPCSDEHRKDMNILRKSARYTNSELYKKKFKLMLNAIEAKARIDLDIFKAESIGDIGRIPMLKAEQLEKKILIAQRSRRFRELSPQDTEGVRVITSYIERMLGKHI